MSQLPHEPRPDQSGTTWVVCAGCGTDLPSGAKFCMACGVAQEHPRCRSCDAEVSAGAHFCMTCGAPYTPTAHGATAHTAPVAARRVTSVLFGDLVGFTTLSEGRDQEEVRELLSRYFEDARRIVARYGGTIEKFIGDAVMAVWGVPTAHEDDAERAVRAGLELTSAIVAMREDVGAADLNIRVGIVTGEVAVTLGATGQGMVAGDPVNTASRVQSVAGPGQVWVDESTRSLTQAAISYVDAGAHELKGKSRPLQLWAVQAVVANVGGAQRADGIEAPLVGRQRELHLIKELFHRTEETRQPSVLVVTSDPGLGKTRLGWELSKYVDGLSDTVRWLEGRCVAYGESVAYFVLAEAIRGRLRSMSLEPDGHTTDTWTLLDLALDRFVPDPREREWIRPRLAVLLLDGHASFEQTDLFGAWLTFLRRLGDDATALVLLIDDAQHADDGFLDFLDEALRADALPVFVLLLARPELLARRPQLAGERGVSVLNLSPLADLDVRTLLGSIVSRLPDGASAELVRRADGVPLYAIETVRSMIDQGLVVADDDGRHLVAVDDFDASTVGAPVTLHALIASRLDSLDAAQRAAIDHASVLGTHFSRDLLAALVPDLTEQLDTVLEQLVRRQVLVRETNPLSNTFGDYGFTQDVVRQVAYGMLSRRDRRAAHLRVVEQLGGADGEPAQVAHHLIGAADAKPDAPDVADLRARARDLLVTASRRTLALGLATGAVEQLGLARELCDDDAERARVDCVLAQALGIQCDFAEQQAVATRALATLEQVGDVEGAAIAAAQLGFALTATNHVEAALEVIRPGWDAMVERGADEPICLVSRSLTLGLYFAGDYDQILPVGLIAMAAAERLGDQVTIRRLLNVLAMACGALRLPTLARGFAAMLTETAQESGSASDIMGGLSLLATQELPRDLDRARAYVDEVDELIDRHRLTDYRGWMTMDRMLIDVADGDWSSVDAAYDDFAEFVEPLEVGTYHFIGLKLALARGEGLRDEWRATTPGSASEASLGAMLADGLTHGARRSRADAAEFADRLVERTRQERGGEEYAVLLADCVEQVVATGATDAVRDLLESLPDSDTDHTVEPALRAHRSRLRGLRARLEHADNAIVQDHLRRAIEEYDAWGAHLWARRTEADLAGVLLDQGRTDEAVALLGPARELYQEIGAKTWLAELPDARDGGAARTDRRA